MQLRRLSKRRFARGHNKHSDLGAQSNYWRFGGEANQEDRPPALPDQRPLIIGDKGLLFEGCFEDLTGKKLRKSGPLVILMRLQKFL